MRIAIVGDDVAGADYLGQFSAVLAAHGQDVTVYVGQRGRRRGRKSTKQDYRVVPMCVGSEATRSERDALPYIGDWASTLERQWSANRPDIVHAYGWLSGLAAQLAARRQRLPTVQSFHGLAATSHAPGVADSGTERQRIETLLARNAHWVTAESTRDVEVLTRLRRSRARLSVQAGGVDTERYTPVGPMLARADRHRILCLARDPLPHHGFDYAIQAMPGISGAELVIAEIAASDNGHDQARDALKQLAARLGVADRVRFMGPVVADQVPKLLRSVDVLACTPRRPPRATTVLQAMASGVAVVTLPVGVLADIVVHEVTGLVLPANRPDELTAALRTLSAQHFQCQSMGAAGRNRALSRFTWDRVALESLNIYQRLTSPYLRSVPPRNPVGTATR